ncbi:MAG: hypothetical protein ABI193_03570 [Minicystis sp.]
MTSEDSPGSGQRLVALTGYGRPEDRRRALDAGFDEHMVKPAAPDEMMKLIESQLALRRTLDPLHAAA